MLGRLHKVMPSITPPDAARWQQIGRALMEGDRRMDPLVAAMTRNGIRESRAQFERALRDGIDTVPDALPELRGFMNAIGTPPPWLDRDRLARGAALFWRCGRNALYVGRDVALMGGYQASAFNRTLILTGALQKGPTRRLAETVQWSLDCTAQGGMDAHGIGWRSTLTVRFIHALVRRSVAARPDWKMTEWGLPINQADMAATLYGALTVPILGARMMGMPQSRQDRDAAAHLTRYVGWLIGVDETWLTDSEDAAAAQLMQLLLSLNNPDETSALMARPLAEEPLQRPYPNFAWLRGRLQHSKHLSISRAFLGKAAMTRLGLPANGLPWYPLLTMPLTLGYHGIAGLLPGGKSRVATAGRAAQEAYVRQLVADSPAVIGQSATAAA
ncbi:MAG: oxygenase MpaB family protein [Nevskiales bacterium]|nr:oxygenase MpaB family protein [Nevskiales bacterium]